jgi:hypothetical protein
MLTWRLHCREDLQTCSFKTSHRFGKSELNEILWKWLLLRTTIQPNQKCQLRNASALGRLPAICLLFIFITYADGMSVEITNEPLA